MNHKNRRTGESRTGWLSQVTLVALLTTGCGGGGSGNTDVGQPPPTPGISMLAGSIGGPGNLDGVGAAARFRAPTAIATDGSGNVYTCDLKGLRRITPAGVVTSWVGSPGVWSPVDGAVNAVHCGLDGIAVDSGSNVYLITSTEIRKLTPTGVVTTLAGATSVGGWVDGEGTTARFNDLTRITVDATGNLYVLDSRTLRTITPTGLVTTLAGDRWAPDFAEAIDGMGTTARFKNPIGVAVDGLGNVFVLDQQFQPVSANVLRKVTPTGLVTTLPDAGIRGVSSDLAGNVYVADGVNLTFRRIAPTSAATIVTGSEATSLNKYDDVRFAAARDGSGNFYMSAFYEFSIVKVTPTGSVSVLAGLNEVRGSANGTGAAATFSDPYAFNQENGNSNDVALDPAGNVYLTDSENATIRRITPAGIVSTVAGTVGQHGSSDGIGTEATFDHPTGIAIDATGNMYVAGGGNTLRRVTPAGVVSTVAGAVGLRGSVDGIGATARFGHLGDVAVDTAGNIYVIERTRLLGFDFIIPIVDSEYSHTIRKITPSGVVTTLAGSAGQPGSIDGIGAKARFDFDLMAGLTVDASGNVYVADSGNHTIRKITPIGEVTTLAGTAGVRGSLDGVGASASFSSPRRLTVDTHGNLFVTTGNYPAFPNHSPPNITVRKISPEGVVTTVAGMAVSQGIALGPLPGSLAYLGGIAVDTKGALYAASQAAVLKIQLPQ